MNRRDLLKKLSALGLVSATAPSVFSREMLDILTELKKSDFGTNFKWGVATAAYQIEGAWNEDGKSPSVWDDFTHTKKRIKDRSNGDTACDFYHRYENDIDIIRQLNMDVFRFSTAWTRVLPQGTGTPNQKGLDFYHRVIDTCLEKGVEPWLTLYHWDLPQVLEDKGGWTNRDSISWYCEYADLMSRTYGDKVKNWMLFNEPAAFTMLGYLSGTHAPGKRLVNGFFKTVHHVAMSQAEGGRVLRNNLPNGKIGSTFSLSSIHPKTNSPADLGAARRMDALLNRLFIEPVLGMGYPTDGFAYFKQIENYMLPGDAEKLKFDYDFVGIQNYFRLVMYQNPLVPVLFADRVKPAELAGGEEHLTDMGWEVYPEGIYEVIKKFAAYPNIPRIIVTENGCAFPDKIENGKVHDPQRIKFFKDYLAQVLRAKNEGMPVDGYFVWSMMDNFEWAEGYTPRFGIVYVDYETQQRTIKDSGLWFQEFLK